MEPHRRERLIRLCIYILPAVMDMVLALILFVCTVRGSKELQLSATVVGGMLATWGGAYMLSCPVVGHFMNRANCTRLLVAGSLCMLALCIFLIHASGVVGIYIGMVLMGVIAALFFVPFQIFMSAVDEAGEKPPSYSTGLYTFAWSMGFALGPFVAARFSELGAYLSSAESIGAESARLVGRLFCGSSGAAAWQFSLIFAVFALVLNACGILLLAKYAHAHPSRETDPPVAPVAAKAPLDYNRAPNMWRKALTGALAGVVAIQVIRGVFPRYSHPGVLALPETVQGNMFFLLSLTQALVGLALCRSRTWMYRVRPVLGFGLFGIAGLLLLGLGRTPSVFYAGGILFGVYSGSFFYYFVFHAIAHRDRASRQVGLNEAVVGIAGVAGASAGGMIADFSGISAPFSCAAALVLIALVFQWRVHRNVWPQAKAAFEQ
ncbi:MAG: hypothetical protein KAI66_08635 [Lentisphaeria bacterium]|nr:hypothetical protein [Lentisphaeria bacterium]